MKKALKEFNKSFLEGKKEHLKMSYFCTCTLILDKTNSFEACLVLISGKLGC
jgi:hypothetical protein